MLETSSGGSLVMGTVSLLVAATKWAKQGAAKKMGC